MRAFTVALLLVVVAACSAFAPVGSRTAAPVSKISLSMANDEVQDIATPEILPDASDAPTKNTVKNIPTGEVREVKWVDDGKDKANSCSVKRKKDLIPRLFSHKTRSFSLLPFVAPTANVSFAMSWGYFFVVVPGVLFLNDLFHIVPKGTLGIF